MTFYGSELLEKGSEKKTHLEIYVFKIYGIWLDDMYGNLIACRKNDEQRELFNGRISK